MSDAVKAPRRYDAAARQRKAAERRMRILDVAGAAFLEHGYAGTTVASIAQRAGVSQETIYKAYGPKAGLVRALWQRGLGGTGARPAPERSDALAAEATEPAHVIRGWTLLMREVSPMISPLVLLVEAAASHDAEMAQLLAEIEDERRGRMRLNAGRLAARGWLREGVSVDVAADLLWTLTSARLYDSLVAQCGWTVSAYADFVGDTLIGALL
jgi:AcrR family transcriptional regulator